MYYEETKRNENKIWGGKYQEIEQAGQGAEAKVYKVEYENQIYALKCFKNEPDFDKDRQLQSQIKDFSHIMKRYDSFYEECDDQKKFCIIYEYCPSTLEKKIHRDGMKEDDVIEFLIQFCHGYKNLYQSGIIHRDLKPENILISLEQKYKIGDFGLSRIVIDPGQKNFMTKGCTPIYASPEMLEGREYSAKHDMYSFGIILFECLHKHNPFIRAGSPPQIKKLQTEFEGKLQETIQCQDENLRHIIIQALKCDQNQRLSWDELFANPLLTQRQIIKENPDTVNSFKASKYFISKFESLQIFKEQLEQETNFDNQYSLLWLWEKKISTLHNQLKGKILINHLDLSQKEFQKSREALLLSDVLLVIGNQIKLQKDFYFKLKDQRNSKIHLMYQPDIDEVLDVQKRIDTLHMIDKNKEQQLRDLFID